MIQNILNYISSLELMFMVKVGIGLFLIILGFKVVNKVLKLIFKLVGIILLVVIILKTVGIF